LVTLRCPDCGPIAALPRCGPALDAELGSPVMYDNASAFSSSMVSSMMPSLQETELVDARSKKAKVKGAIHMLLQFTLCLPHPLKALPTLFQQTLLVLIVSIPYRISTIIFQSVSQSMFRAEA